MTLRSILLAGTMAAVAACVLVLANQAAARAPNSTSPATTVATAGIETGGYHSVITFSNVTGLPPRLAQNMMARPHETDGCAHTGDINKLVQDAIAAGENMSCTQNQASAANGVISGAAACQDDSGISGTLQFSGTYTSTHVDVNGDLAAQTPMGAVTEHIHLVSDHTGPACRSDN